MSKREQVYLPDSAGERQPWSRNFLETVIEASYDGIYITDGSAVTVMINKSYLSITGLRREDVLGRSMTDLVRDGVISESGTLAALARREPVTLEQTFRTGKQAIITSTPIFDNRDRIVFVVTNVRDMTEFHNLRQELAQSRRSTLQYYNELENLRRRAGKSLRPIAEDPAMQEVLLMADKAAELDVPILIEGDAGTGKRELARYIAAKSRRRKEKFFELNCYDYPDGALEKELFGEHTKSGADVPGMLELADGGTVYLQEIAELSADCQLRLSRLMETGLAARVGGEDARTLSVRIIAGTSRDIRKLAERGAFRKDLYYGLTLLPIRTLPLRERRGDIAPLAMEMCMDINRKYRKKKRLSDGALLALKNYAWPGNLAELRNVVESAVILSRGETIEVGDLPISSKTRARAAASADERIDLRRLTEELELKYIREAYRKYGNVRDAAKSLGMTPSTFVRRRRRLEGKD